MLQILIYSIFLSLEYFDFDVFIFVELFLDDPAMAVWC